MPREELRRQLASLHDALRNADALDPDARALLERVMDDIRALLEREPGSSARKPEPDSVVDRLREAVDRFEGEHPTLSEAAGRVIDALAQMGI
jgi:predicted component of type VI protein secretion system